MEFLIKNNGCLATNNLLIVLFHTYDTLGTPSDGLKAMFEITAYLVNGIYR